MSDAWIGAAVGAGFGLASYAVMAALARTMEGDGGDKERSRQAAVIRRLAQFEIPLFAVVGYFVGPMILQ